jgi:hypothetical protein
MNAPSAVLANVRRTLLVIQRLLSVKWNWNLGGLRRGVYSGSVEKN